MIGLYIVYTAVFGILDGLLWGQVKDYTFAVSPHKIASVIRLLLFALLPIGASEWWRFLLLALGYALMFSLFHNGMYYETRRIKSGIDYNFFTTVNTSTGWTVKLFGQSWQPLEFGITSRLIQFVIGSTIIILCQR